MCGGEGAWQGGMHGRGACMAGGMCDRGAMCGREGRAWRGGHAWQERRPLQRAVLILLECILV